MPWDIILAALSVSLSNGRICRRHRRTVSDRWEMTVATWAQSRWCHNHQWCGRSGCCGRLCQRINYKLALLTYKTRSTGTPAYTWRLYWKVTGRLEHCDLLTTRMWANAQRDGRHAEYRPRWRPLFNAALWLTPTTSVPCSNAAKTRNPLI